MKKPIPANWYRLADGTQADPGDCSADDKGVLTHKSGVRVSVDGDGKPVEIVREPEVNKTALAAEAGKEDDDAKAADDPPAKNRELKAGAGGKPYKTR